MNSSLQQKARSGSEHFQKDRWIDRPANVDSSNWTQSLIQADYCNPPVLAHQNGTHQNVDKELRFVDILIDPLSDGVLWTLGGKLLFSQVSSPIGSVRP